MARCVVCVQLDLTSRATNAGWLFRRVTNYTVYAGCQLAEVEIARRWDMPSRAWSMLHRITHFPHPFLLLLFSKMNPSLRLKRTGQLICHCESVKQCVLNTLRMALMHSPHTSASRVNSCTRQHTVDTSKASAQYFFTRTV